MRSSLSVQGPRIRRTSSNGVNQKLERQGQGDHVDLGGHDDGRFAGRTQAIPELSEQAAGHVVDAVMVVAADAPKQRRRQAGLDAEGRRIPPVSSKGRHEGEAVDDGDEHRATKADLDFLERVGEHFAVGAEAEAGDTRASEEDVAACAQVKGGVFPELVLGSDACGTDGERPVWLGVGERHAGGASDGKNKRDG